MEDRAKRAKRADADGPHIESERSPRVSEELIMLVVEELEAHARAAGSLALSLRLAAGMAHDDEGADFDARVGELLLRAHVLLAGETCSLRHGEDDPVRDYTGAPSSRTPPARAETRGDEGPTRVRDASTLGEEPEAQAALPEAWDELPASLRPPGPPSSELLKRITPAPGSVREEAGPMSSGPPPATSGVRMRKAAVTEHERPPESASEPTPRGFATHELQRWYESLTKATRGQ